MRPRIDLRVSDIKQYNYCGRIVFYNHVMPVDKKTTFKMEAGRLSEEELDRLESRRKLRKYGLKGGRRRFHVDLRSAALGLTGKVDMVIETRDKFYPIDFKFTDGGVATNHRFQLAAYALLLEEANGCTVDRGFIYLIPAAIAEVVELTDDLKRQVRAQLEEMRAFIAREDIPDPTPFRARCQECEYRNFCGDIF